jgi:hypothetical protein
MFRRKRTFHTIVFSRTYSKYQIPFVTDELFQQTRTESTVRCYYLLHVSPITDGKLSSRPSLLSNRNAIFPLAIIGYGEAVAVAVAKQPRTENGRNREGNSIVPLKNNGLVHQSFRWPENPKGTRENVNEWEWRRRKPTHSDGGCHTGRKCGDRSLGSQFGIGRSCPRNDCVRTKAWRW